MPLFHPQLFHFNNICLMQSSHSWRSEPKLTADAIYVTKGRSCKLQYTGSVSNYTEGGRCLVFSTDRAWSQLHTIWLPVELCSTSAWSDRLFPGESVRNGGGLRESERGRESAVAYFSYLFADTSYSIGYIIWNKIIL